MNKTGPITSKTLVTVSNLDQCLPKILEVVVINSNTIEQMNAGRKLLAEIKEWICNGYYGDNSTIEDIQDELWNHWFEEIEQVRCMG